MGVNQLGGEVNHSCPSRGEAKHEWNSASAPPIEFYGIDRDSFMFTFCHVFHNCKTAIVDTTRTQTMHLHPGFNLCSSMLKLALELL